MRTHEEVLAQRRQVFNYIRLHTACTSKEVLAAIPGMTRIQFANHLVQLSGWVVRTNDFSGRTARYGPTSLARRVNY
jgi:hypothetical protein